MKKHAMKNKILCDFCEHLQCGSCHEELNRIFPKLWFGCCSCGEQAQLDAYNLIEARAQ